jgi:hypothetical protein
VSVPAALDAHVGALAHLLGRRDRRATFNGTVWRRESGDPLELFRPHLAGDVLLGSHHGGTTDVSVVAWDIDGVSHDRSGERSSDAKAAVAGLLEELRELGLAPPLVASSKSGSGFHVYVLLAEPIPLEPAHRLAIGIRFRVARPEVDKAFPSRSGDGLVLALPWCGLLGAHPLWIGRGGSRICHPHSLLPYDSKAQLPALTGWPRSDAGAAIQAANALSLPSRSVEPAAPSPRRPLPIHRCELDVLAEDCAFVQHCADDVATISYEEWFSLATVLRVFSGGPALFDRISAADPARYRAADVRQKLASIRGAPRHCDNLGWTCPKRSQCQAIGVSSPAGLPFKLAAARKGTR